MTKVFFQKANVKGTVKWVRFFLLCFVLGLFSCDSSTIYNENEDLVDATWLETDTLVARFEVTDTNHYHNVFLNARFSALYPKSNIYFKAILLGPGGQNMTEVKGFEITDKTGKWLGKGFGSLHSYAFPIFEELALKQLGKYKVKLIPYMRISELKGIHDRGIKVNLGQEIF